MMHCSIPIPKHRWQCWMALKQHLSRYVHCPLLPLVVSHASHTWPHENVTVRPTLHPLHSQLWHLLLLPIPTTHPHVSPPTRCLQCKSFHRCCSSQERQGTPPHNLNQCMLIHFSWSPATDVPIATPQPSHGDFVNHCTIPGLDNSHFFSSICNDECTSTNAYEPLFVNVLNVSLK